MITETADVTVNDTSENIVESCWLRCQQYHNTVMGRNVVNNLLYCYRRGKAARLFSLCEIYE